ncbi:MAG: hypothetical protein ACRD96_15200, partial [Bryobacteraceae bacterium]
RNKKKLEAPDPVDWNRQLHIVRVFDQLIVNTDRNLGHLVITMDWKIWMIDHTRAFRMLHTLQTPKNLVQIDRKLLARLRDLSKADAQVKLKGWLNNMEIDGLFKRRDAIVKHYDKLIQQRGEAAIVYDWL